MKILTQILLLLVFSVGNAQPINEYLEMSPEEFFSNSIANQVIDTDNPDHNLLTIATFHATNLLRTQLNIDALQPNQALFEATQLHASEMISGQFFNHIHPNDHSISTPRKRVNKNGGDFDIISENIALVPLFKSKPAGRYKYRKENGIVQFYDLNGAELKFMTYGEFGKSLVKDWYDSKPHRKSLLSEELTHLGLAVRIEKNDRKLGQLPEAYAVQNFGAFTMKN